METDTVQAPNAQPTQTGASSSSTPQPAAVFSQTSPKSTSNIEPEKDSKSKKLFIFPMLLFILAIIVYSVFLGLTYWNCNKISPQACETGKCTFSLTGFNFTSEIRENCCGNTKCELSETHLDCSVDCPSCDDQNECTSDSFDYIKQGCVHEQTIAPCNLRAISLSPATPEDSFQVKIELSSTSFDYSKTKADGADIRIFDENNSPLNFWIESWNKEGASTIWVKVPSLGTDRIYMSYGYPNASSASNGSNVFDYFEDFNYGTEADLLKVWTKHGNPTLELSNGAVTISTSGSNEEHGGQYIFQNVGEDVLLNNIVEMSLKRFSGGDYANHMANIGYSTSAGGPIGDNNAWAVLRYNPSPDGGMVVFGGNNGGIASPPVGTFNTLMIYHRDGVSYAYEPLDTKVAQYSWPSSLPHGNYILLGGQTYQSGFGKASYSWIRVRRYSSTKPTVSLGNEEIVGRDSLIKELY